MELERAFTTLEQGLLAMTSSPSGSSITVTTSDLAEEVATDVRRSFLRDLRFDMICVFVAGFALGGGGAQVVAWFTSWELSSPKFFAFGFAFGLFGSLWIGAAQMRDFWRLRADLAHGRCEIVRISPRSAIHAHLGDDVPAIAFDCGAQTLVIVGNWWKRPRAHCRVNWTKSGTQKQFPSSDFTLTLLPLSGRVLAVEVNGSKIKVKSSFPVGPIIPDRSDNWRDCFTVDEPLQELERKWSLARGESSG